jgi:DNA processing protein
MSLGIGVHLRGEPTYPSALAEDPQAPAVLFSRGRMDAFDAPRVAIIGTRRCTHYGREVAAELGHDLAVAGAAIVSGLAYGIDGAAHHGACAAGASAPIGIVASGLDVIYPPRHAELWHEVAEKGVLLSEGPLGTRPDAWRFPTRNRLIAASAQALVIVESHAGGGSMHTVEAAIARSRPVLVVPGSVHSPASVGTNQLLADGCHPARDAADVLVALGIELPSASARRRASPRDESGPQADVLGAVGWEPTPLDVILARTGKRLGEVALALDHLVECGAVRAGEGWWERVRAPRRGARAALGAPG